MNKIKIAVAGLGRIGKIHLKNLCRNFPELQVIAVMDVFDESKAIADEFSNWKNPQARSRRTCSGRMQTVIQKCIRQFRTSLPSHPN